MGQWQERPSVALERALSVRGWGDRVGSVQQGHSSGWTDGRGAAPSRAHCMYE